MAPLASTGALCTDGTHWYACLHTRTHQRLGGDGDGQLAAWSPRLTPPQDKRAVVAAPLLEAAEGRPVTLQMVWMKTMWVLVVDLGWESLRFNTCPTSG